MRKLALSAVFTVAALALSGCGIPDLLAHGIKSAKNTNQATQPVATSTAPAEPPPPVAVERGQVVVEQLPPR